jgi:hypothetical protein
VRESDSKSRFKTHPVQMHEDSAQKQVNQMDRNDEVYQQLKRTEEERQLIQSASVKPELQSSEYHVNPPQSVKFAQKLDSVQTYPDNQGFINITSDQQQAYHEPVHSFGNNSRDDSVQVDNQFQSSPQYRNQMMINQQSHNSDGNEVDQQ